MLLHLWRPLCASMVFFMLLGPLGAWEDSPTKKRDPKQDGPKVTTTKTESGKESKIRVLLPVPEAKLYFDGTPTKATGKERVFRSPALEEERRYTYKVTARWMENGRETSHDTNVYFRAGEDVVVDFRR